MTHAHIFFRQTNQQDNLCKLYTMKIRCGPTYLVVPKLEPDEIRLRWQIIWLLSVPTLRYIICEIIGQLYTLKYILDDSIKLDIRYMKTWVECVHKRNLNVYFFSIWEILKCFDIYWYMAANTECNHDNTTMKYGSASLLAPLYN